MADLTSLMIAIPNQGHVATPTMTAVLTLAAECYKRNIALVLSTFEFSDIVISRNVLMSRFLAQTGLSHCLWLDSDMGFSPDVIFRMAEFGADWVVAPYPQKRMPWRNIRRGFEAEAHLPDEEKSPIEAILQANWTYNHQPGAFEGEAFVQRRQGDFATVQGCGAGLMLMTREVPAKMVAAGVAPAMPRMNRIEDGATVEVFDFFSHLVAPNGDYLYAEDQSVCLRWARVGGEIWMDTSATITHIGSHTWVGQYSRAME